MILNAISGLEDGFEVEETFLLLKNQDKDYPIHIVRAILLIDYPRRIVEVIYNLKPQRFFRFFKAANCKV